MILTERAKSILDASLVEYNNSTDTEKITLVSHVKNMLEKNEKAIDVIGMGFDRDMVEAAKEFLKTIKQ